MGKISEKLKSLGYRMFLPDEQHDNVLPRDLETKIGYALPVDYMQFLRDFPNTGIFDDMIICRGIQAAPCADDYVYPITFLFAVCARVTNDLLGLRGLQDEIPLHLLVIGVDDGGNYFCLDLRRESFGRIYFLFHEEGTDGLYLLANDFSSFIDSLAINS